MEYHSGGSLPLLGRPRYCPGAKANGGYLCETGHCCGETGCCTYYYELWWFWLLWTVLILFSCCCAYRHRRAKLRLQQQQQLQQGGGLLAHRSTTSYPSSMLDLSFLASLKLPSYEEVAAQPSTPPPPYSSVFTAPRYPQPPRSAEPHLLTQRQGPLLHLSDGPSSFSSDNSSSCSCDSCCPSSLCSSSISAPITYETDTSHASTPGEATPLTLEVRVERVGRRSAPGPRPGPAEDSDEDPLPLLHSPPPCPTEPPDPTAAPPSAQACGPAEGPAPAEGPPEATAEGVPSPSGPSSPAFGPPGSPSSPLNLETRTCPGRSGGPGPVSEPPGRPPPPDHGLCLGPDLGQASVLGSSGSPTTRTHPPGPGETWSLPAPGLSPGALALDPDPAGLHAAPGPLTGPGKAAGPPEPALTSPSSSWDQSPDLAPDPGPRPGLAAACLVVPPPTVQTGCPPGPGGGPLPELGSGLVQLSTCGPALESRPAITIEAESSAGSSPPSPPSSPSPPSPPSPLSPPSPPSPPSSPSPPSPPALTSSSLPATILLLDPSSVPHQASKGGSSSGHASSLSPSPRTTQSPPKQTLFSPCVDVFEPEPLSWEEGEEDEDEDEDEEDVGADESQYRRRRLTGDSGIEVCRCRVEGEGPGEELGEEPGEGLRQKEGGSRGVQGEGEGRGAADTAVHDSRDCPARSPGQGGHTPTRPPPSQGAGKPVAMETA